jgi:hypothetical protein
MFSFMYDLLAVVWRWYWLEKLVRRWFRRQWQLKNLLSSWTKHLKVCLLDKTFKRQAKAITSSYLWFVLYTIEEVTGEKFKGDVDVMEDFEFFLKCKAFKIWLELWKTFKIENDYLNTIRKFPTGSFDFHAYNHFTVTRIVTSIFCCTRKKHLSIEKFTRSVITSHVSSCSLFARLWNEIARQIFRDARISIHICFVPFFSVHDYGFVRTVYVM